MGRVHSILFGHRKVRYKGLVKNTAQLFSLFGLANLVFAWPASQRPSVPVSAYGKLGVGALLHSTGSLPSHVDIDLGPPIGERSIFAWA
ncbi:hypothetical protein DDK22_38760 [Cupriavidus necator]|uniref:Uncharacterized protein n=1 Tax=Cupriavidus necator TaxID=106590 RepID=A0A367P7M7_CUPNE|nr:hypothetical protein DDK22_38760 [Cupriavidus necator]